MVNAPLVIGAKATARHCVVRLHCVFKVTQVSASIVPTRQAKQATVKKWQRKALREKTLALLHLAVRRPLRFFCGRIHRSTNNNRIYNAGDHDVSQHRRHGGVSDLATPRRSNCRVSAIRFNGRR